MAVMEKTGGLPQTSRVDRISQKAEHVYFFNRAAVQGGTMPFIRA
jgi:hypothetical protein